MPPTGSRATRHSSGFLIDVPDAPVRPELPQEEDYRGGDVYVKPLRRDGFLRGGEGVKAYFGLCGVACRPRYALRAQPALRLQGGLTVTTLTPYKFLRSAFALVHKSEERDPECHTSRPIGILMPRGCARWATTSMSPKLFTPTLTLFTARWVRGRGHTAAELKSGPAQRDGPRIVNPELTVVSITHKS